MSREMQIKVTTYEEERLNYFTELMKKSQKRYKRLFKKFKDAPYLSAESEMLSDAGREAHFHGDVVEMLEKGYRKQEWISVDERLPDGNGKFLTVDVKGRMEVCYWEKHFGWFTSSCNKNALTHWMPLPDAPKMKGGTK